MIFSSRKRVIRAHNARRRALGLEPIQRLPTLTDILALLRPPRK